MKIGLTSLVIVAASVSGTCSAAAIGADTDWTREDFTAPDARVPAHASPAKPRLTAEMVQPVASRFGHVRAAKDAECLAATDATLLEGPGQRPADGRRTGSDPPQRIAKPAVREGRLGESDGQAVRSGIHPAITRSAKGTTRRVSEN